MRYTPDNITSLAKNEVFVFGSNESGVHGAGAALLANEKFEARMGQGFGFQGKCFAIPTKDWIIRPLPINILNFYVERFLHFATKCPDSIFLVTKIGCGLAGHSVREIAPLFFQYGKPKDNIIMPEDFWIVMQEEANYDCIS